MIVYPLSKRERRIVRWIAGGACCASVLVPLIFCLIHDLIDWLEGLIPLFRIGIEA